ncbi:MAG: YceI family protein [Solirubrobacterales bacterium]|nr:YceI family protein [Solirubrobacterales bacterium]
MATQQLGPQSGTLKIKTYREGVAQRIGHDLVIEVAEWDAAVDRGPDGAIQSVKLNADSRSLQVREGHNGLKPLSDKDRTDIRKSIDEKVLRGRPISFASTAVEPHEGGTTIRGDLTMADSTRPAAFDVSMGGDGHVAATLPVTQSQWGIKPYKGLMGALKMRDTVEIVLDVRLPAA